MIKVGVYLPTYSFNLEYVSMYAPSVQVAAVPGINSTYLK